MSFFPKAWNAFRRTSTIPQTGPSRGHAVIVETAMTVYGSCQPMDGKAVQVLPVGKVSLGKIKIFTSDRLEVSEDATGNIGDVVVYDGRRWEVIWHMPWDNGLLPHNEYVAEYRGVA